MNDAGAEKFIYVFDTGARDKLLMAGMTMVGSYDKKEMYIFVNDSSLKFALDGIDYVRSNKLTF